MAGLLMPLLLLVGGYIFYTRFGGKEMLDNALNEIKSVGGGGGSSLSSGFEDLKNGRTGQWTDKNDNNFNVQSDTNTESNVGKSGNITQKRSNVQKSGSVFYTIPRFGNL